MLLFVLVGLATTVTYFAVAFFLERRTSLFWTISGAFWSSLPLAYILQRVLVFGSTAGHLAAGPKFLVVQLAGFALNQALAVRLERSFPGRSVWLRRLIILIAYLIAALGTYLAAKYWAFAD